MKLVKINRLLDKHDFRQVRHLLGVPGNLQTTKEGTLADQIDELSALLDDHAKAIETIEGFMGELAKRAETAVDPTRLQAVMDKVKEHNSRLAALLVKFPLIK